MTDGQQQPRIPFFDTARVGGKPTASEQNKLTESVRRQLTLLNSGERYIGIELYRLVDAAVGTKQSLDTEFASNRGYVQRLGIELADADTADKVQNISSSSKTVYDVGERPPGFFHRQSGAIELLNPRFTRNAITVANDGDYPLCGSNKFPIKFVRREYCNEDGQEKPRIIYLDSQTEVAGSSEPDAWVFVQEDDDGISDYIPEGNVIEVFDNIGLDGEPQWHSNTVYGGTTIIRIPDGGIPAGNMEKPGAAYCAVYRLIGDVGNKRYERVYRPVRCLGPVTDSSASSASLSAWTEEPYGSSASGDGLFIWVNNLSFTTVTGIWAKPSRDRGGDWLIDCPCSGVGSSSSSSPSSSSPSSSPSSPLSSSSEPSSESSELSSPSSLESSSLPSPSQPSSESESPPSSESESPPSESPPSEPSLPSDQPSQQSSKSTAIVPSSWNESGYTALFITEMPEVRFEDIIRADIGYRESDVEIDYRFVEVCEPGTIECCGCVADQPIGVTAFVTEVSVDGTAKKKIRVIMSGDVNEDEPVRVVIRLTGIRKGFPEQRFPDRTRAQFESNERFINSAYEPFDEASEVTNERQLSK